MRLPSALELMGVDFKPEAKAWPLQKKRILFE